MFRTPLSLDGYNRVSTGIACALFVGVVAAASRGGVATALFVSGGIAATFGVVFAMSPRALVVLRDELRIERRMWPALRIARVEIQRASQIASLGTRIVRVGGVGGFFGSFGLFRSAELGTFRLYATRGGHALRIDRNGALPIVVTPDDIEGVLAALDPRTQGGAFRSLEPHAGA